MANRGLCFSWSHCLCLHCFSHLKLNYADTHTNIRRIFIFFELHTHASDFSGSVKLQTLPPYLILIYTLLWLCAENCRLVTTNARLSTFWQLTKCTNNAFWLTVELSIAILLYNRVDACIGRWEEDEDAKSCAKQNTVVSSDGTLTVTGTSKITRKPGQWKRPRSAMVF